MDERQYSIKTKSGRLLSYLQQLSNAVRHFGCLNKEWKLKSTNDEHPVKGLWWKWMPNSTAPQPFRVPFPHLDFSLFRATAHRAGGRRQESWLLGGWELWRGRRPQNVREHRRTPSKTSILCDRRRRPYATVTSLVVLQHRAQQQYFRNDYYTSHCYLYWLRASRRVAKLFAG